MQTFDHLKCLLTPYHLHCPIVQTTYYSQGKVGSKQAHFLQKYVLTFGPQQSPPSKSQPKH